MGSVQDLTQRCPEVVPGERRPAWLGKTNEGELDMSSLADVRGLLGHQRDWLYSEGDEKPLQDSELWNDKI